MFDSLLIANRGEIAVRIARTARAMGIRTIGIASAADVGVVHGRACDHCVPIGGERAVDSYLRIDKVIEAARQSGAQAVHPGYGFLAESEAFARAVIDADLVWVGPPPAAMSALGAKAAARQLAASLGVPVVPGYDGDDQGDETLIAHATRIGYPLLIKASAGGGGRGMRRVNDAAALSDDLQAARRESQAAFGDARLVLERAVEHARHVEVQVFGDAHGNLIHLGERDCSVQRRHQKLIEEAPCPVLTPAQRRRMGDAAVALAQAVGYVGAGTVEMLLQDDGSFYFMEMNTRLQVEHPVTEALLGIDLVAWQLRIAAGQALPFGQDEALRRFESGGHAIEARLCAEDTLHGDLPQAGVTHAWRLPERDGLRCDHALADGQAVSPFYDSMLAKLIVHAPTRDGARLALALALDDTVALGVATNRKLLATVLRDARIAAAQATTTFLDYHYADRAVVLPQPGATHHALAALWLATRAAADLPSAWAASPLCAPRETVVDMIVDGIVQRWHLRRDGRSWFVRGVTSAESDAAASAAGDGQLMFDAPCWFVDGALASLQVGLLRDANASASGSVDTVRLDGLMTLAADGATLLYARSGTIDFTVTDLRHAPPTRSGGQVSGDVRAPMHGRLALVHVAVGDTVLAGQALAVLEAMKMEHTITAPMAGRVTAIGALQGVQVAPSLLLMRIEGSP